MEILQEVRRTVVHQVADTHIQDFQEEVHKAGHWEAGHREVHPEEGRSSKAEDTRCYRLVDHRGMTAVGR